MRSVRVTPSLALVVALAGAVVVGADGTPQPLPFAQDWSDTWLITANDVWTGALVAGFVPPAPGTKSGGAAPATVGRRMLWRCS